MAMVGGIIALIFVSRGRNEPIGIHNGALAGLVAICSGSDVVQPISALIIGVVAGLIFSYGVKLENRISNMDDALGVWPLHGLSGSWGGIATGIFGLQALGGLGGVNIFAQLVGVFVNIVVALVGGFLVFKSLDMVFGFRLSPQEELTWRCMAPLPIQKKTRWYLQMIWASNPGLHQRQLTVKGTRLAEMPIFASGGVGMEIEHGTEQPRARWQSIRTPE